MAIDGGCVTGTYLSHVLAGRKEASSMLVYLLEAYALSPAEFQRRHSGGAWTNALAAAAPTTRYEQGKAKGSAEVALALGRSAGAGVSTTGAERRGAPAREAASRAHRGTP